MKKQRILLLTSLLFLASCGDSPSGPDVSNESDSTPPEASASSIEFSVSVGDSGSLIELSGAEPGSMLYRSTDPACDIESYLLCDGGAVDTLVSSTPLVSTLAAANSAPVAAFATAATSAASTTSSNSNVYAVSDTTISLGTDGYMWLETESGDVTTAAVQTSDVFPKRRGQTHYTFNGSLFFSGGYSPSEGSNSTIWKFSESNKRWIKMTDAAEQPDGSVAFSPREEHTVVEFNGKLWLTGGYSVSAGFEVYNDIWSSEDGVSWILETDSAAFPARGLPRLLEYDNKLWLMGGYDSSFNSINDVWVTEDGVNWSLVTNTPKLADDSEIYSNGVFENALFVKDGKIWSIGGRIMNSGLESNCYAVLYTTIDGATWEEQPTPVDEADNAVDLPYCNTRGVVFNDTIYLEGSKYNSGTSSASYAEDLWLSSDGANWAKTSDPDGILGNPALILYKDQLVVQKVRDASDRMEHWASSDGENWDTLEFATIMKQHNIFGKVDNALWQLAGVPYDNRVLRSTDGYTWEIAAENAIDAEGNNVMSGQLFSRGFAEFANKLWVVGGNRADQVDDVWSSADGLVWDLETGDPKQADGSDAFRDINTSVTAFQNKLWVVGGSSYPGAGISASIYHDDVWSSSDGVIWELATDDPKQPPEDDGMGGQIVNEAFGPRGGQGLFVVNSMLCAIGGHFDDGSRGGNTVYDEIWCSSDGVQWSLIDNPVDQDGNSLWNSISVADPYIAYFSGGVWLADEDKLYSTNDGQTWTRADIGAYAPLEAVYGMMVLENKLFVYDSLGKTWVTEDGTTFNQIVTGILVSE